MKQLPFFSIIIPTLNEEMFLPKLLESLNNQTYKNFEVIVSDGASFDKTVEVALQYKKKLPALLIVRNTKASLPMQRNEGAKRAKAKWYVFVDADSVLMPYFMDRVRRFIDHEHPSVFTTWFQPDSTVPKDAMFTLLSNLVVESSLFFKRPYPPGPLAVIRHDIFNRVGGYDETHRYHEDIDLGLRLRKDGVPFSVLRETLYIWSLRRFRHEGTLKVMQQYVVSILPVIFLRRAFKAIPGYVMGGHLYGKKYRMVKQSVLTQYERKLKKYMKDVFG